MIYDIPRQFPWRQTNKGDFDGTIWSSRNIDLTRNIGSVSPTEKLIVTTKETTDVLKAGVGTATATFGGTVGGGYYSAQIEPSGSAFPSLSASAVETGVSVTSVTKSLTVPSGSNQCLIVRVAVYEDASTGVASASGVTWNGSAMTQNTGTGSDITTGKYLFYQDYYLQAPAQVTGDVVVTLSGTAPNAIVQIFCYDGVQQTGNPMNVVSDDITSTGGGEESSLTVTPTESDYNIMLASAITEIISHTQTGGREGNSLFNADLNSVCTYSTYEFGGITLENPTDLTTAFCKERGTVNAINATRWWSASGTSVYQTSTENGDFDIDDSVSLPVTGGKSEVDIKNFNNKVYACWDGFLYSRSGTTWTLVSSDSALNNAHCLEIYLDRLYIATDTTIVSIDTADALATTTWTLDIKSAQNENLTIKSIRATSYGIWIIASNTQGGRAKAMLWDGVTENTLETQKTLEAGLVYGLSIKDDIPYVLDANGHLSKYNGSFFDEVGRFDFNWKQLYRFDNTLARDSWMHPNGMQTINGEILMAVNTRTEDTNDEIPVRHPAGIYAFNEEFGIYHKYSFTAQEDSATYTDHGHLEVPEVGAIFSMHNDAENDERDEQSDLFVGYAYKTDNATTKYVIAKADKRGLDRADTIKVGVIITPFLRAEQVQDQWKKLYTFIRPFKNSTDKIVVKVRKQEYDTITSDITWVDTTSFTTTDANWATVLTEKAELKDFEVEGLSGDGAGYCSHITEITEAGGTYTVTLDEVIANATTNTARVRVTRWEKVNTSFSDDGEFEHFKEFNPDMISTKAQFKLYLVGTDIELDRLAIYSSPSQKY